MMTVARIVELRRLSTSSASVTTHYLVDTAVWRRWRRLLWISRWLLWWRRIWHHRHRPHHSTLPTSDEGWVRSQDLFSLILQALPQLQERRVAKQEPLGQKSSVNRHAVFTIPPWTTLPISLPNEI